MVTAKSTDMTVERSARCIANGALLMLMVYLVVSGAQFTWLIVSPEQPIAKPLAASVEWHHTAAGLQSVGSYNLFGVSTAPAGVVLSERQQAPETGLQVTLSGVMVGRIGQKSGAIIVQSSGESDYYREGDSLPGGVELVEVQHDRVLIRRNGRYESLTFEDSLAFGLAVEGGAGEPESITGYPDDLLSSTRERLDSEGVAAFAPIGLRPSGSGVAGYVYDGSNAMLNAVNLQAGDVITSINGQALGDLEQDKQLLDSWREQSSVDVQVSRNGMLVTVSYAVPEQWL
jgi:general secretion pathway protein C